MDKSAGENECVCDKCDKDKDKGTSRMKWLVRLGEKARGWLGYAGGAAKDYNEIHKAGENVGNIVGLGPSSAPSPSPSPALPFVFEGLTKEAAEILIQARIQAAEEAIMGRVRQEMQVELDRHRRDLLFALLAGGILVGGSIFIAYYFFSGGKCGCKPPDEGDGSRSRRRRH